MQLFSGGLLEVLKPDLYALLPSNLLQSHRGVRCISNFFCVCIFGCKCKLGDCGGAAHRRRRYVKRKGIHFLEEFFFSLISTNSLVGWALSFIAAITGVLYVAVSVNMILGPKGQIPGSWG